MNNELGCKCHGCGRIYKVDLLISDELWYLITYPDRPEMLCGMCIMERIEEIGKFDYYKLEK